MAQLFHGIHFMTNRSFILSAVAFLLLQVFALPVGCCQDSLPALSELRLRSSIDGTSQPVRYWAPLAAKNRPTVLFVFLHSWSSDYKQDNSKWQREAVKRDWIFLHPNFRGANVSRQACGSKFARQDILDSIDWALRAFKVDRSRIYLCGVSGGGHMSMLMAGHHPDRFSAPFDNSFNRNSRQADFLMMAEGRW